MEQRTPSILLGFVVMVCSAAGCGESGRAAFDGTLERSERAGAGGVATLDTVRVAQHGGFERVVFEFREELPGYVVEYASERPAHCGSGEPAEVAGSAHLVVRMTPARAHEFFGERAASTIAARDLPVEQPALRQLLLTCDFEADVSWVLALDSRRPYRVSTLANPPRVVVDVEARR